MGCGNVRGRDCVSGPPFSSVQASLSVPLVEPLVTYSFTFRASSINSMYGSEGVKW